jgi:hypothetical protein
VSAVKVLFLAPWQLSFQETSAIKGKSKTVDILATVRNFLTPDGYQSEKAPLDVLFMDIPGMPVGPFSVGHSVGFGKSLACQMILLAVVQRGISDADVAALLPALRSLRRIQATFDPASDMEEQVLRSLKTKMHMTSRQRPDALQLAAAFAKSVTSKMNAGDTRARKDILTDVINRYNAQAGAKGCRIHTEETAAIILLDLQTDGFVERLKKHWQTFLVAEWGPQLGAIRGAVYKLQDVSPCADCMSAQSLPTCADCTGHCFHMILTCMSAVSSVLQVCCAGRPAEQLVSPLDLHPPGCCERQPHVAPHPVAEP